MKRIAYIVSLCKLIVPCEKCGFFKVETESHYNHRNYYCTKKGIK